MSEAAASVPFIDVENLDAVVTLMMEAIRHWSSADRDARLGRAVSACRCLWQEVQRALSDGAGQMPLAIRQNLLIVSVYAEGKLSEFERSPSREALLALIMMTRNLAASLRPWRQAA